MSPLLDRTRAPVPGTVRPFEFPAVRADALASGLALRVARLPRLPVVASALVIPAGESTLDLAHAGHAALTGDALEGGTRARSGSELAESLEGIGAALHVSVGWDATTVSLASLADRWEDALALLAEVVLEPAFTEEEVTRVREQQLARLRQRAMDPASLANDRAAELIHAEGVPYGRPASGTIASVESFDPAAARAFAAARYRPQGGGLVVAGDVDADRVAEAAGRVFGGWEGAGVGGRDFEVAARFPRATVHVIDRPDAVQSEIRIGHPGAAIKDPAYHALVVMNSILGGTFTSRLNLNLRERHGFTYGVRSGFAFRRSPGPFNASTAVATDVTAPAVREIMAELSAMAERGPTEEEMEGARDYLAGVFPLRLETTGQVAARIAELIVYDLPADHHARYRERIRAVTRDDAAAAARRHVRPGEATVVVVGAADAVRGPLEELGIGPLTVHPAS
jgi:zinc protease